MIEGWRPISYMWASMVNICQRPVVTVSSLCHAVYVKSVCWLPVCSECKVECHRTAFLVTFPSLAFALHLGDILVPLVNLGLSVSPIIVYCSQVLKHQDNSSWSRCIICCIHHVFGDRCWNLLLLSSVVFNNAFVCANECLSRWPSHLGCQVPTFIGAAVLHCMLGSVCVLNGEGNRYEFPLESRVALNFMQTFSTLRSYTE